ncbi:hypothetical protein BDZ45DRAFT_740967 [Acephala macrosclerotiorum]|nr:hypothetical protein BDZ45DRAFT_740967 [Acephala macrosclerotiorum]
MDPENLVVSDGGSDTGSFEIIQEHSESNEAAEFCERCEQYAQTCEERNAMIEGFQKQSREKYDKIDGLSKDANDVRLEYIDLAEKHQVLTRHISGLDNHVQVLERNYTALQEERRFEGEKFENKSFLIETLVAAATHNQSQLGLLEIEIEERNEITALKNTNLRLEERLRQRDKEAQQSKRYALQIQEDVHQMEQNVCSVDEEAHKDKLLHQDKLAELRGTIVKRDAEIKALTDGTKWRDEVIRELWTKVDVAESELKDQARQHKKKAHLSRQTIGDLRTDTLLYEAGIADLRDEIRRLDIDSWIDLVRRQAQLINSLSEKEVGWAGDLQSLRQEVVTLREELHEERLQRAGDEIILEQSISERDATIQQQHQEITALRNAIEGWNLNAWRQHAEHSNLQLHLGQRDARISQQDDLNRDLEQRDARISQQDEQIAALREIMQAGEGLSAGLINLEHSFEQREARILQQNEQIAALIQANIEGNERESDLIQRLDANADVINALFDRIIEMEGAQGQESTSQDLAPQSTTPEGSPSQSPFLQSSTMQDPNEMTSLSDDESMFIGRGRPIVLSTSSPAHAQQPMPRDTADPSGADQSVQMTRASQAGQDSQITQHPAADIATAPGQAHQAPQARIPFIVIRTSTQAQMLQNSSTYEEYYAHVAERARLNREYDELMLQQHGDRLV